MKLYTIEAGFFKLDGGAMFGVVPKSIWQRTNPADENNLCTWATRLLLIESGRRLILIDTGLGNKQDTKFFDHYHVHGDNIDDSLARHGFSKNDITDVLLTHLHFDHVGGAVERKGNHLVPAFENAIFWSNQKHWEWATHPNDREKASFLKENIFPLQESEKLKFIEEGTQVTFADGIAIRYVNGHTKAMMLPQITYKGKTILYMADLLPSVGHIPLPYVMSYDMFPLETLKEKKTYLEEALNKQYILFLEHDPIHECCTLKQTEKGIRLDKTFRLQDI
ncbi:MBL fold metallo-hydrolase [Olivibacter domesticus]|uniref:Glyoxylase, beta-lactamase superfamily II n=1 Tax=Olivibacter domesticus TaxID=407022 RepID=A0A1H7PTZ1_OLID1|nr:MBL fold metallo-hydrolase [Olivibacter domesticus]SEL39290.1 Glyoxylase, beta-lactamase superfamily II [Olivibacter domesticus]